MRILVTGAGGYIGRHVVAELLRMNKVEIVAADYKHFTADESVEIIECDIFDKNIDIFDMAGRPDVCVHMAWRDGFVHNSDAHMSDLSKHYEFCLQMATNGLKQLAVMGSMHEIGYFEGAINEHSPCKPLSLYGIAKNALREALMCKLPKETILLWLRAYYIVGDDKFNHSIFTKLLAAEEMGQTEFPFTNGKNLYDFITVSMLAKQIAACVVQDDVTGIIECCTGKPKSLAQQVEEFIKELGLNIKLKYGAFPDRQYDSPGVWGDSSKILKVMERTRN